nr:MAG TPA: hypothetical protein [Caudoviricetes sp.]
MLPLKATHKCLFLLSYPIPSILEDSTGFILIPVFMVTDSRYSSLSII